MRTTGMGPRRVAPIAIAIVLVAASVAAVAPASAAASAAKTPAAAAAKAAAKKRADLAVVAISVGPATVKPGAVLRVRAAVKNVGRGSTGRRTAMRFVLSRDRRAGGPDRTFGSATVTALQPRRTARVARTYRVPRSVHAGHYYVVACADTKRQVRESREKNNCRATGGRVRVVVPKPPKPPTPPTEPPSFPQTPDPLDVTYTTQSARAVTSTVPPYAARTLTTTAADGTRFDLTIPRDALLAEVDITLTPVARIDRYPFASMVGAVELQPHGLTLLKPARLTITPPAGTNLSGRTGFKFDGAGKDFHLYPVSRSGAVTMDLMEFSTPGAGTATSAQVASTAAQAPRSTLAQYQAAAAEATRSGSPDQVRSVVDAYARDVVEPKMEQGLSSDDAAREAIHDFLSVERLSELVGFESPWGDADWEYLWRILRNWVDRTHARCVRDHDLSAISDLLGAARTYQLLGAEVDSEVIAEKAVACARFEVRFTSLATEKRSWPLAGHTFGVDEDSTWQVESRNLVISPAPVSLWSGRGDGTMTYSRFDSSETRTLSAGPSCPLRIERTIDDGTTEGVARANLNLDLNGYLPNADGVVTGSHSRLSVSFVAGQPSEWYERTVTGGCQASPPTRWQSTRWRDVMGFVHARALSEGVSGDGFDIRFGGADQDGATLYRRDWDDEATDLCAGTGDCTRTADTRLELIHAPLP